MLKRLLTKPSLLVPLFIFAFCCILFILFYTRSLLVHRTGAVAREYRFPKRQHSPVAKHVKLRTESAITNSTVINNAREIPEEVNRKASRNRFLIEQEQVSRKKLIHQTCIKYTNGAFDAQYHLRSDDELMRYLRNVYVDEDQKLLYCNVPKVACTNWKRVLLASRANGSLHISDIPSSVAHNSSNWLTLKSLSSEERKFRIKNYFKFVFVRNPYERLLSAYKDKFEQNNSAYYDTYYETIKRTVYGSHRKSKFGLKQESKVTRLQQHQYQKYQPLSSTDQSVPEESQQQFGNVTFSEFLKFVTSTVAFHNDAEIWAAYKSRGHNRHWARIVDLCNPCFVNYDFIGHYKNIDEEAEYVLNVTEMNRIVHFPTRNRTRYGESKTIDSLQEAYANISQKLIDNIKRVYALDFEMFGYSADMLNKSKR